MNDIFTELKLIKSSGEKAAFCIVVDTKGSVPAKAGSKMIVFADKNIRGTIGGGSLELKVIEKALEVIKTNKPEKLVFDLGHDLEMHCGGFTEVYIEPVLPENHLYIFGAGHIGKELSKYADDLGFMVTLIDPRAEPAGELSLPGVLVVQEDYISFANKTEFDDFSYIVILTPKHQFDEELLSVCSKKQNAYLGMIGSKEKVAHAKKKLLAENVLSSEQIDKLDMPIGIKFNAKTPKEIAISILARLIDVRNSKS
jgi:xanthine dehydrogenase accessory factor